MTGETNILKASETTSLYYWVIQKAFQNACLSPGVLYIVSFPPSFALAVVDAVIKHPAVRQTARVYDQYLKPCLVEFGGKNSAIILEDADLSKPAEAYITGCLPKCG